ncbi:hypothetical protein EDD18DRAFT_1190448 [Armillaria luteobubalina]|uniref:Uncharacterized protein n=1 Tax=Armillaria luteobubalina TaxID=153913 RepID=A0AA39UQD2_9AGAR|nr:hypothetical protein EDD18DRAFT_1190448 [Armillaria luteobubalina]
MSLLVNQGSFPAEIVDVIIDSVHYFSYPANDGDDDRRTKPKDERCLALKSCSLVCRAWVPRSRYHLFRTTTVSLINHRAFMQLIASPNCSFLSFIDTLVLEDGYNGNVNDSDSDTPFWRVDPECVWLPQTLPTATLPIFPNIRKLLIITGAFYVISKEDCAKILLLLSNLPSLTHLALIECIFYTVDDVTRVLSSCQALESARLENIILMQPSVGSDSPGMMAQSHLPSLPASLSSLAFTVQNEDSDILQIISVAGTSLKHLSMSLTPFNMTRDNSVALTVNINLEYSTSLESIVFQSVPISNSYGNAANFVRHIPEILRQITSSSIKEIVLTVWLTDVEDFDNLDWKSITKILSRENYRNLRKFSVVFGRDDLAAESKERITQNLKPLTDTNLSVEIVDYSLNHHQFVEARLGW